MYKINFETLIYTKYPSRVSYTVFIFSQFLLRSVTLHTFFTIEFQCCNEKTSTHTTSGRCISTSTRSKEDIYFTHSY